MLLGAAPRAAPTGLALGAPVLVTDAQLLDGVLRVAALKVIVLKHFNPCPMQCPAARLSAGDNLPGDDSFHIQRIHGDREFNRFKNWMTVDRRKMKLGRGFDIPQTAVSIADVQLAVSTVAPKIELPIRSG